VTVFWQNLYQNFFAFVRGTVILGRYVCKYALKGANYGFAQLVDGVTRLWEWERNFEKKNVRTLVVQEVDKISASWVWDWLLEFPWQKTGQFAFLVLIWWLFVASFVAIYWLACYIHNSPVFQDMAEVGYGIATHVLARARDFERELAMRGYEAYDDLVWKGYQVWQNKLVPLFKGEVPDVVWDKLYDNCMGW
jgi:hypothetical protein